MKTKVEYKNKNALIALEAIIALIGLVVLIIGIFLIARTINFNSNSERIEAIVEACEKYIEENNDGTSTIRYQTYVNYMFEGKQYTHVLLSGINTATSIGNTIHIRINMLNPEDARLISNTSFMVILVIIIGLLITGGFTYLLIATVINKDSYKKIIADGAKVIAKVTRVYPERNAFNTLTQYYLLDCEYMEKIFTSYPFKGGEGISDGDLVPVYYTSLRKGIYYVDVKNVEIKHQEDNGYFK